MFKHLALAGAVAVSLVGFIGSAHAQEPQFGEIDLSNDTGSIQDASGFDDFMKWITAGETAEPPAAPIEPAAGTADAAPDASLAPITLPDTGTGAGQGGSLSLVLAALLCAAAGTGVVAGSRLVTERERE